MAKKRTAQKRTTTARARKTATRTAKPKSAAAGKLSLTTSSPSFTVNDIDKSLAWYLDVLGFTMGDKWENGGKLMGAEISAGKTKFWIGQDDWKKGRDRVKGLGVRIYCTTTNDIDALAKRIKSKGGTLADEPRDEWGMRHLTVDDPDGFKITISKRLT